MYLKKFWSHFKTVSHRGPCPIRPCPMRSYCNVLPNSKIKVSQNKFQCIYIRYLSRHTYAHFRYLTMYYIKQLYQSDSPLFGWMHILYLCKAHAGLGMRWQERKPTCEGVSFLPHSEEVVSIDISEQHQTGDEAVDNQMADNLLFKLQAMQHHCCYNFS